MKNVNYKQLKRYDIGKMSSRGFEEGLQVGTIDSSVQTGNDLSSNISYAKSLFAPQLTTRATSLLTSLKPVVNLFSQNFGKNAAKTAGTEAAKTAGLKAFGSVMDAAGYLLGAADTVMSGILTFSDAQAMKEKIDPNTIVSTADRYTDSRFGQTYNAYGQANRDNILDYVKASNKTNKTNLALSSATTAANAASTIGSIWGPVGALAGWLFGAGIGGTVGGKLGSKWAQLNLDYANTQTTNFNNAAEGYNMQQEAVAASKGLRRMSYNGTSMDKGKSKDLNIGNRGMIGLVHTPNGVEMGIQYGYAGKDETIMDGNNASLIEEGTRHVDNVPVGVSLNSPDPDAEWDNISILGHNKNKATGKDISDEAKPYAKILSKDDSKMDKLGKHTLEVNKRNAFKKLMLLDGIQTTVKNNGKYDYGKVGDYASMILPRITQAGLVLAANQKFTPTVRDIYAESNNEGVLNELYGLSYNPSQAIHNLRDANKQSLYSIINQGGISGGVKGGLRSLANIETAKNINDLYTQYYDKNIDLKKYALGQRLSAYMADAQRKQQANQYYAEAQAKAEALPYQQKQAFYKSMYDLAGAIGSDFSKYNQYQQAKDYNNKLIDIYYQDAKNKDPRNLFNNSETPQLKQKTILDPLELIMNYQRIYGNRV